MSNSISMRELELEGAEMLPARETLFVGSWHCGGGGEWGGEFGGGDCGFRGDECGGDFFRGDECGFDHGFRGDEFDHGGDFFRGDECGFDRGCGFDIGCDW